MNGKCLVNITIAFVADASDQYRIVNGRSANAESDERVFKTFKEISNKTSNHHADNIISNAFIRCQVRKDFESQTHNGVGWKL